MTDVTRLADRDDDSMRRLLSLDRSQFGFLRVIRMVHELLKKSMSANELAELIAKNGGPKIEGKSLTGRMKAVEKFFGARLFERDRASGFTKPTKLGTKVYHAVRTFLDQCSVLAKIDQCETEKPALVIAVSKAVLEFILPPVLNEFSQRYKDQVEIRCEMMQPGETAERLRRHSVHIALGWHGSLNPTGLDEDQLHTHSYDIVLAAPSTFTPSGPVTLEDLKGRIVMHSDHPPIVERIRKLRHAHDVHFIESTTMKVTLEHVRLGTVCGLVPDIPWVLDPYVARSELEVHPISFGGTPPPNISLAIFQPRLVKAERQREVWRHAAKFIKLYKENLNQLPGRRIWDDYVQDRLLTADQFDYVQTWHIYFVGAQHLGPTWYTRKMKVIDFKADGKSMATKDRPIHHTFRAQLLKSDGATAEGTHSVSGSILERSSNQVVVNLDGQVADERATRWTAMFGRAISISGKRKATILVGNRMAQGPDNHLESSTMILSDTELESFEIRQIADHSLVRYLQNASRHETAAGLGG